MIEIHKSETADSRTCDFRKVSVEQLLASSKQHISDVLKGMRFFEQMLEQAAGLHDFDKVEDIDGFHKDFLTNFKQREWYKKHLEVNRHHIDNKEGCRDDINLVDVIEHVVDCVMAGLARSGEVSDLKLSNDVLQKAFANTVALLKKNVALNTQDRSPMNITLENRKLFECAIANAGTRTIMTDEQRKAMFAHMGGQGGRGRFVASVQPAAAPQSYSPVLAKRVPNPNQVPNPGPASNINQAQNPYQIQTSQQPPASQPDVKAIDSAQGSPKINPYKSGVKSIAPFNDTIYPTAGPVIPTGKTIVPQRTGDPVVDRQREKIELQLARTGQTDRNGDPLEIDWSKKPIKPGYVVVKIPPLKPLRGTDVFDSYASTGEIWPGPGLPPKQKTKTSNYAVSNTAKMDRLCLWNRTYRSPEWSVLIKNSAPLADEQRKAMFAHMGGGSSNVPRRTPNPNGPELPNPNQNNQQQPTVRPTSGQGQLLLKPTPTKTQPGKYQQPVWSQPIATDPPNNTEQPDLFASSPMLPAGASPRTAVPITLDPSKPAYDVRTDEWIMPPNGRRVPMSQIKASKDLEQWRIDDAKDLRARMTTGAGPGAKTLYQPASPQPDSSRKKIERDP